MLLERVSGSSEDDRDSDGQEKKNIKKVFSINYIEIDSTIDRTAKIIVRNFQRTIRTLFDKVTQNDLGKEEKKLLEPVYVSLFDGHKPEKWTVYNIYINKIDIKQKYSVFLCSIRMLQKKTLQKLNFNARFEYTNFAFQEKNKNPAVLIEILPLKNDTLVKTEIIDTVVNATI